MTPNAHPRSLASQVSTQQVGLELLVYDERRHQAFCLNAVSAAVWKLCDGQRTVEQIAAAAQSAGLAGLTEEAVLLAVDQLHADGLVVDDTPWMPIPEVSRRVMMQRLAVGAAVLVPGVAMVMAPKAAQAYNGCADCNATIIGGTTQQRVQQWQKSHEAKPIEIPRSSTGAPELVKP